MELRVEAAGNGYALHFRTNVDEWVACGRDYALRFELEPATGGIKLYLNRLPAICIGALRNRT